MLIAPCKRRRASLFWRLLLACSLSLSGALALAQSGPVEGTSFESRLIEDAGGRAITYHISRAKAASAPLMLMIQGSGCARVFSKQAGGASSSSIFNLVQFGAEGRFTVIAVEKPFSDIAPAPGSTEPCSAAFHADFTADSWARALQAAMLDARKISGVKFTRTLVLGGSEGAVMASMLAAREPAITDVVFISGSGTTQLFDFIAQAYRSCFDVAQCLKNIETTVAAIGKKPHSSLDFAWGHSFQRWTSFFALDPGELLLKSRARVYIALGTADSSVPAVAQEVAVAKLLVAGRDVTVRRVADGDHGLRPAGVLHMHDLDRELRAALGWFWNR